jgi:hypothetical protein
MRHIACRREMKNAFRILVGKPEGKRELRIPTWRLETGYGCARTGLIWLRTVYSGRFV